MPWRSAEVLLFDLDEDGRAAFPFWLEPLNVGGKRTTSEIRESGMMHRSGAAAIYRHQQTTDCDCSDCRKARRLASQQSARAAKGKPKQRAGKSGPLDVDSAFDGRPSAVIEPPATTPA